MVAEEIITTDKIELSPVCQKALILISEYLGKYTSDIYQNFYQDKDDQIILASVSELLEEVVGASKASQLIVDHVGDLKNNPQ